MTLDDLPQYLRERIVVIGSCWIWARGLNSQGSAQINKSDFKSKRVHRVTFEMENGPIPDALEPDHLCRARCCINPHHLEAVTRRINTLRGDGPKLLKARHDARTHCKRGHEFTPDNTYRWARPGLPEKTAKARRCRECNRLCKQLNRTKGTK